MEQLVDGENARTLKPTARECATDLMTSNPDGRLTSGQGSPPPEVIFGQTAGMRELQRIAEKVAATSAPILILGEKGTGKEVLARHIHYRYAGPEGSFFKVRPPVSNGNTFEQVALRVEEEGLAGEGDLGLWQKPLGRVGTLYVEEVADLDLNLQFQLFQLIQGSRSFLLGGDKEVPLSPRVICASSHNLEEEVVIGRLREDLLTSLSVVKLFLPALRERKEDIPQLAQYFSDLYSRKFGCQTPPPPPHLVENLQRQAWPGNIGELESALKRYVVFGTDGIFSTGFPASMERSYATEPSPSRPVSLKQITREAAHELEGKIILRTLQKTQWNRKQAARALMISYRSMLYKIKEANLEPKKGHKSTRERSRQKEIHGNVGWRLGAA